MRLNKTGKVDHFDRPVYKDEITQNRYVDVNMNDDNPSIHSISTDGEPIAPIRCFKCSICKDIFIGIGHNPAPLADGECCVQCNCIVVIERFAESKKNSEDT